MSSNDKNKRTFALTSKGALTLAAFSAALAAGCAHREHVTVVQAPASPTPAPQTVVVEHDKPDTETHNTIIVHDAPPPPREESVPSQLSDTQVWSPGHWEYRDGSYTWVEGHLETKPQPTAVYVPPHWEERGDGYVYVPGYWR